MKDALLLVDVLNDVRHEGADTLLASFRGAATEMCVVQTSIDAREEG